MTILHGIPNCDTVKKARAWLDAHGVAYAFHDYRKVGVDAAALRRWVERLGWEAVLNRNGTTFRKLPEAEKVVAGAEGAIALMLAHPSAIRRPMLESSDTVLAGFKPDAYLAALNV